MSPEITVIVIQRIVARKKTQTGNLDRLQLQPILAAGPSGHQTDNRVIDPNRRSRRNLPSRGRIRRAGSSPSLNCPARTVTCIGGAMIFGRASRTATSRWAPSPLSASGGSGRQKNDHQRAARTSRLLPAPLPGGRLSSLVHDVCRRRGKTYMGVYGRHARVTGHVALRDVQGANLVVLRSVVRRCVSETQETRLRILAVADSTILFRDRGASPIQVQWAAPN